MSQFTSPGGRFKASATTLKFLLEWAYGILPSQHSGGPSWIGTDRYDVVAKAEGDVPDRQMKLMMQTLLADRFKLKLHHERKNLSVLAISIGKAAPGLYPSNEGEVRSIRIEAQTGADQKTGSYRIVAKRFSLAQLADTFGRQLGRVVMNETGLDGEFDFTLDLTPDEGQHNPMDSSLLISAMREQLGMTVKSQNAVVDVLAIDRVEKVVAGN